MTDMKKGFTLVEFLIVIGILALSVGSIMLILTTVVKGVNQTNIQAEVKQNGQAVLDTLTTQIRSGSDAYQLPSFLFGQVKSLPTGAESAVWLFGSSGERITIACVEGNGTTTNGYIGIYVDSPTAPSPPANLTDFKPLSNTDPVSGVDIDCGLTSTSAPDGFKVGTTSSTKLVQIEFVANQGVQAPSRVDFKANALFRSSASLRIYQ